MSSPDPNPPAPSRPRRHTGLVRLGCWTLGLVALGLTVTAVLYWTELTTLAKEFWTFLADKEAFRRKIESFGPWAPLIFVLIQVGQIIFAPIPGELTGVAGGYVFGWLLGLTYSTIGLSLGSWINFFLARILGRGLVERIIPAEYLAKVAYLMERQGVIASFIFFIIPGFPKDYLCFVLGLSPLSWRIFALISSLGRIPGTLMLSLQGAAVYQENYWSFLWLGLLSLAFILPAYLWREIIYQWLQRFEQGRGPGAKA